MKMENLEFGEAVEWLDKKFNIQLEYESGGPSREEISLRKQLFEIHELATDWFHRQFLESDEAASVRTYWQEQRGFTMETAADLKIGYAPAAQDTLAASVRSVVYPSPQCTEAVSFMLASTNANTIGSGTIPRTANDPHT